MPRYMLDYRPPRDPLIPWAIPTNDCGVPYLRFSRGLPVCYLDEEHPTYSNTHYRRAFIEDDKEETCKDEFSNEDVLMIKPNQVLDNNVSCSVLTDNANHHLPRVGTQSYVDATFKRNHRS